MRLLYTLGIYFFGLGIKIASVFNPKAAQWTAGRKNWKESLRQASGLTGCIWFHCASLGEFEQGRPLLEKLKSQYPSKPILLTFFSPSGYLVRKNYGMANYICYLPLDTPANVCFFLDTAKPDIAIFVKYEVWHNFFNGIAKRKIPLLMISAIFRKKQIYFKPFGKWFRKSLKQATQIYTQDTESLLLLKEIGIQNTVIAGDTRFDRVIEIAEKTPEFPELRKFTENQITVVAGSTWPADEDVLSKFSKTYPEIRFIIAPHEIDKEHINSIIQKFPGAVCWSEKEKIQAGNAVIIDSIGLLSSIYKYGNIAYIGGGFGTGIHNTLEPAVYGMPVIFGPHFQKFKEAVGLCNENAAKSIQNYDELQEIFNELISNTNLRNEMGRNAAEYVKENVGATEIISHHIASLLADPLKD